MLASLSILCRTNGVDFRCGTQDRRISGVQICRPGPSHRFSDVATTVFNNHRDFRTLCVRLEQLQPRAKRGVCGTIIALESLGSCGISPRNRLCRFGNRTSCVPRPLRTFDRQPRQTYGGGGREDRGPTGSALPHHAHARRHCRSQSRPEQHLESHL